MAEPNTSAERVESSRPAATGAEGGLPAGPATDGRAVSRAKKRRPMIFVIASVILLVGGFFLWRWLSSYESTDDAQVDVHLYPVSSRISGYVIKVNVGDNEYVEKGTVLVEIDPKDYEVALAQARANLANSEATAQSLNITVPITSISTSSQLKFASSDVENANAGIVAAEKQLLAARAQVEQAEANDVKAQDDLRPVQDAGGKARSGGPDL